jgi:glucuronoarabinoxylan endo-1,4-beta-xylanase
MKGYILRAPSSASVLGAALMVNACIGVYGQKPEVESVQQAEVEEQDSSGEISDSLGASRAVGKVSVSAGRTHQKIEGFGASVAWYQDLITGKTPEDLYDFLFPELGLDILRYRNRFQREGGEEDSNLAPEMEIHRRATAALGYKPRIMLTSWSPPASLKASGNEKCRGNEDCTLKKKNGKFVYEEFADWWLASLKHYKAKGLAPYYVSMQNEPSFIPPDWEGCKFEPKETDKYPGYGKALEVMVGRLSQLDFKPKVLGPETLGVHYNRVQNFMAEIDPDLLYGVAHHLYEKGPDEIWDWRDPGPDSYLDEMLAVAASTDKPIFQTEFNTDEDKGIEGGFETAWLIHHSMAEQGTVAFLYWDLIWPEKGLVAMRGRTPKPRDQYYSLKHFARYTDPGYVRVEAVSEQPGLLASAYLAPDRKRLTLVLLNTSQGILDVEVAVEEFEHQTSQAFRTTYRPGNSKRWEELGALAQGGTLYMPARSVATVVFDVAP